MAEWIGRHMQGWPTWAVVIGLSVASIVWAAVHLAANWPTEERHYLGEKKKHDQK